MGVVYYHWHQLEQAHSHFLRAIRVSTLGGYSDAEIYYGVVLSRLFRMVGDLPAAAREVLRVVDLAKNYTRFPAQTTSSCGVRCFIFW